MKGEMDTTIIIGGDFHILSSTMDRYRKKTDKYIELNNINHNIINIHRTCHPGEQNYRTYSKKGHILGYKTNCKCVLQKQWIKLEVSNRKVTGKSPNTCKLKHF